MLITKVHSNKEDWVKILSPDCSTTRIIDRFYTTDEVYIITIATKYQTREKHYLMNPQTNLVMQSVSGDNIF